MDDYAAILLCLMVLTSASAIHSMCPPGETLDSDSSACVNCPSGSYKDSDGPQACTPCETKHTTRTTGATSPSQCVSCYVGWGTKYTGDTNVTASGRTCQMWNKVYPHNHTFARNDDAFQDGNVESAKNHCRNPDRSFSGPWCYTTDPNVRTELCDIPECTPMDCPELDCTTKSFFGGNIPLDCRHGHKKDEIGCPICKCITCPQIECSKHCEHGYKKRNGYPGCKACECQPEACPAEPSCWEDCPYGFSTDERGCQTDCQCKPECDISCFEESVASHISWGSAVRSTASLLTVCECTQRCQNAAGCIGFDFNYDVPPYQNASCWLHDSSAGAIITPDMNVSHFTNHCAQP